MNVLGIDVGKSDLHAALLLEDRSASKSGPNSQAGIAQLQTWLKNRKAERVHVCMEATGGWSEQVAISLSEAGHVVSIVNPARIKAFAQSVMVRTKTDRFDAALIARFCRLHQPEPWTPPAPEVRILQGLVRRQHSLIDIRVEEENRRAAPMVSVAVMASIVKSSNFSMTTQRCAGNASYLSRFLALARAPRLASSARCPTLQNSEMLKRLQRMLDYRPVITSPARSNAAVDWQRAETLTCAVRSTSPPSQRYGTTH